MPFYRRRRSAPLKSDKHEVSWSNLAQDAGTAAILIPLVTGVASADKNNSVECEVGSHVRAIYLEFHFSAETVTNQKVVHWQVVLRPNDLVAPIPTLYYQAGRNQIIKRGMEMLPRDISTVYKRIVMVRIPKKGQRIGLGDKIQLQYQASSTESINACGIAIYKELY